MKIIKTFFLVVILSLSSCSFAIPEAISASSKAESTYAKCLDVEKYYLAKIEQPLPKLSDPNSVSQPIVASGEGFFWNQPGDMIFIPSDEVNPTPVAGVAKAGTYLAPQKVTCDLNKGSIVIDMKASFSLDGKAEPLIVDQIDEMYWNGDSEVFKGQVLFTTTDNVPYFKIDSDFVFRGCNEVGTDCNSIDILLLFPLPKEILCGDFAKATYGLEIEHPNEVESCGVYTDNMNYFWDKPEEVVVFEEDGNPIIAPHLQVVNNVWLEVAYRDKRAFEYRGASCYLQYTSNAEQDWENPEFNTSLCSPRKIVQIRR